MRSRIAGAAGAAMALAGIVLLAPPAGADSDTTGPVAAPSQFPAASANGWSTGATIGGNIGKLEVTWNWADTESGINPAACQASTVVNDIGVVDGIIRVTGACTDLAGNTATATTTVKLDTRVPFVYAPDKGNPHNGIDYVTWKWYETGSGIDRADPENCPATTSYDRYATKVTATCADIAGNIGVGTVEVNQVKQPSSVPTTSPAPNAAGWTNAPTTINWNWVDYFGNPIPLGDCAPLPRDIGITDDNQFRHANVTGHQSVCSAGNVGTMANFTVKVDTHAPTAAPTRSTAANAAGWTSADTTITWNWTDARSGTNPAPATSTWRQDGSGIDPALCPATTVVNQDAGTVTGTCTDIAGNTATQTYAVNVDKTAPALAPALSATAPAAGYAIGSVVTAAPNATDAGSGIASSSCGTVDTATAGTRTIDCIATDNAGNTGAATVSYTVAAPAYTIAIASPTAGTSVKAGKSVPVDFTVTGSNGQKLTAAQGKAVVANCGVKVTIGTLAPACAAWDQKAAGFSADVSIPKATAAGTLPVKIAISYQGQSVDASTTVRITK